MYKPYEVRRNNCIVSKVTFENDNLFTYKFDAGGAKRDAAMLNGAFINGVSAACAQLTDREEAKRILQLFLE